jgi:hypothetical protein
VDDDKCNFSLKTTADFTSRLQTDFCCRDGGGGEPGGADLLLPAGGGPEHGQRQVVPQHHRDLQDRPWAHSA